MNRLQFSRKLGAFLTAILVSSGTLAASVEEVRTAIADAEKAVAAARSQRALWTSAEDALRQARRALDSGDTGAALEHARTAVEHAALGIGQTSYPLVH